MFRWKCRDLHKLVVVVMIPVGRGVHRFGERPILQRSQLSGNRASFTALENLIYRDGEGDRHNQTRFKNQQTCKA